MKKNQKLDVLRTFEVPYERGHFSLILGVFCLFLPFLPVLGLKKIKQQNTTPCNFSSFYPFLTLLGALESPSPPLQSPYEKKPKVTKICCENQK